MATISLENVRKEYAGQVAVEDVSVTIAEGELVSLVGPSGCGKSTTLNLIAGLETPTSGTIRIDKRIVNDVAPGARDLAMVFQSYALYPHLDVRRNLAFPLEVAGLGRSEIAARVAETAEMLGISSLLDRRPKALSGGQRQRVALGRALVRKPKAFLLDEPLSNLDAELRSQMRGELKRLHERLGATFLYVTHDQTEAMTLSDRIVVMNRGRIQQVGAPGEIYERPRNTFVAGFFGTPRINLVAPSALGLDLDVALVGVRPEALEVGRGPPVPGSVAGVVDLLEPMGAENWVSVRLRDVVVTARASSSFSPAVGDQSWVRAARDRVLRFDASGHRVGEPQTTE